MKGSYYGDRTALNQKKIKYKNELLSLGVSPNKLLQQ
jgi:hypothetical protein